MVNKFALGALPMLAVAYRDGTNLGGAGLQGDDAQVYKFIGDFGS